MIVAMLALRLEAQGLAPVPRLGRALQGKHDPVPGWRVEPRQVDGPTRGQSPRRQLVSTETTVIDDRGVAQMGSKDVYLKKRAKGTERADKAAPNVGVARSSSARCPHGT